MLWQYWQLPAGGVVGAGAGEGDLLGVVSGAPA
jgi:hypothetical protein